MEGEKYAKGFSFSQIPLGLRHLLYQTFNFQPFRQIGDRHYEKASLQVGATVESVIPEARVFLNAGGLSSQLHSFHDFGLADLEFLVLKDKAFSEDEIWDLRAEYFQLMPKYPFLGSVALTQNRTLKLLESSSYASSLSFRNRKQWTENHWKRSKLSAAFPSYTLSRVARGGFYLAEAQKYLVRFFRNPSQLTRAHFLREIGRALFLTSGETLESIHSHDPAVLMAHAFYELQQLALLGLADEEEITTQNFSLAPTRHADRFSAETSNRSWISRLRKSTPDFPNLRATSCRGILTPLSELNIVGSCNLFTLFQEFIRNGGYSSSDIPLIVPVAAFEAMELGWHWSHPLDHLNWIYPSKLDSSEWSSKCATGTFEMLRERVLLELNCIQGKLVTHSPESVQKALQSLLSMTLMLKNRACPSSDPRQKRKHSELPAVSFYYEQLNQPPPILNLNTLLKAVLESYPEIGQAVVEHDSVL